MELVENLCCYVNHTVMLSECYHTVGMFDEQVMNIPASVLRSRETGQRDKGMGIRPPSE